MSAQSTERLEDFNLPWCQKLLSNDNYRAVPFSSRHYTDQNTRNFFWARTLATPTTIRAIQALVSRRANGEGNHEHFVLVSIGSGSLDGHENVLHGAVQTMLLDEAMAFAGWERYGKGILTASIHIDFQATVETPGVYLCQSREVRREERKIYMQASLRNGEGRELASAKGLFIRPRERAGL